jgi:CTP:molybdopterin cytidylyltransferase MocA
VASTPQHLPAFAILCAGASSRLGQPKALCDLPGGRPLLRLLGAAHGTARSSPKLSNVQVVVVTGCHHLEIEAVLEAAGQNTPGLVAQNMDWTTGRTSSIQLAVRTFPDRDLMLMPVDHPRITAAILDAMIEAWHKADSPAMGWLAPFHEAEPGQKAFGHPILLGRGLGTRILDLSPHEPLRALRATAEPLLAVSVTSAVILENLDTPAALLEIREADRL